jgi:predicted transcriptional regulator
MAKSYQPTEEDILKTLNPSQSFLSMKMDVFQITQLTASDLGYKGVILWREKGRTSNILKSLQEKGLVDRKSKWDKKWYLTQEGRDLADTLD